MPKKIMIQGTSSGAGKSMICTALCRVLTSRGHRVAPFKPQNMALNSFVTIEGLEMGRAQVVQAEACKKIPSVHMNPILLKPCGNHKSQVIVQGKVYGTMESREYSEIKKSLLPTIKNSFDILGDNNDIIIIEGAGSPAELNMMKNDISNMESAKLLDAPVILVADIDRGGVFASIYGTIMLQSPENRERIKGIIINKFKGKKELLEVGISEIEKLTGVKVLGIMPYEKINLEDEDSISEKSNWSKKKKDAINIEVVKHPHISNTTDFEIFRHIDDVNLRFVEFDENFENPDLIIIPGTKNTIADLRAFKKGKLHSSLLKLKDRGVSVVGICGGFQMLGKKISDPKHLEDELDEIEGLGLLNHSTVFEIGKTTTQARAKICGAKKKGSVFFGTDNIEVVGYEVHSGTTYSFEKDRVFTNIIEVLGEDRQYIDGVIDEDETVFGTYLHGIFDNMEFTNTILNNIREKKGIDRKNDFLDYENIKEREFERLEKIFLENIDIEKIYEIMK